MIFSEIILIADFCTDKVLQAFAFSPSLTTLTPCALARE